MTIQSVAFTKTEQAVFAKYEGMKTCLDVARKAIQKALDEEKKNFVREKVKIIEDLSGDDFSLRTTGAPEACRYIAQLAKELRANLQISFHYRNRDNVLYPVNRGMITLDSNSPKV